MAHALIEHDLRYQYHCPECKNGSRDSAIIMNHILRVHPERPIQLLQVFHRIVGKNKQTLGFYCMVCREAASSFQKMSAHCESEHKTRLQWKCYHCDFANSLERYVVAHMEEKHSGQTGLAQLLFDRVFNHIPDRTSWNMATALEESTEKSSASGAGAAVAAAPPALPAALPTNEPTPEQRAESVEQVQQVLPPQGQPQEQQVHQPGQQPEEIQNQAKNDVQFRVQISQAQAQGQERERERERLRRVPEAQHIITEVVDLLASDDEVEEIGECQEDTVSRIETQ